MSLPRKETIECPKCGSSQEICFWSSVNVTTDPELKQQLLDGSLMRFQCRDCRYPSKIESDLLYHDMTKRLAVWLKYPGEDGFFGIDPAAASLGDIFGETYVRRVVPSYEELLEKIKTADAGFDDFELELVKLLICIREQIDVNAPFMFGGLKTSALGEISVVFTSFENNSAQESDYPLENIQSTITRIRPLLARLPVDCDAWPYVNREYVLNRLSAAGLMNPIE